MNSKVRAHRVKPEPREWLVTTYIDGGVRIHTSEIEANHSARYGAEVVKVREVLDGHSKTGEER